MPAKDFGTKHTCFKCGTKFYDMKKPDPICPKCGADQRESPALKPAAEPRRSRLSAPKPVEPAEVPAAEEAAEGEEEEVEEIEGDDAELPADEDL